MRIPRRVYQLPSVSLRARSSNQSRRCPCIRFTLLASASLGVRARVPPMEVHHDREHRIR